MRVPLEGESGEIIECVFRAGVAELTGQTITPENLCHFKVDQVRGVQAFSWGEYAVFDGFDALLAQEQVDQRGGIENDQLASRSSRTRSADGRETRTRALPARRRRSSEGLGRPARTLISATR